MVFIIMMYLEEYLEKNAVTRILKSEKYVYLF